MKSREGTYSCILDASVASPFQQQRRRSYHNTDEPKNADQPVGRFDAVMDRSLRGPFREGISRPLEFWEPRMTLAKLGCSSMSIDLPIVLCALLGRASKPVAQKLFLARIASSYVLIVGGRSVPKLLQ